MNFEAFRNHNFQKNKNSKIFNFDTENTIRRPKIHQSGTRLRESPKWILHGAKHSPSESLLGGNIGKPGGPPVCVARTPLDRFFSHWKNVPEVIRGWYPHDFWRSFAWRSRFFCRGTGNLRTWHPIGHFLGVIMKENIKMNRKKPRKRNQIKIWCEALSFRFDPGATLENRGVLHSVWPGPLWTDFSPIERTF